MHYEWYRKAYGTLLRLYPRRYRERYAEGMAQTFHDLCREHANAGHGLLMVTAWAFADTLISLIREHFSLFSSSLSMGLKTLVRPALITLIILLIPTLGNHFVEGWNWSAGDFLGAGTFIFGTGLAYELLSRKGNAAFRGGVGVMVVTALLLLWVTLAVGVAGGEDNPANVLYLGVVLLPILGTIIAQLEPRAMARALFCTAVVQLLTALLIATGKPAVPDVTHFFLLNGFFAALWAGAGVLFWRAAGVRG